MASNPVDLAAAYEARTVECEERCRSRTTTQMTSGTARNAPKGPHIRAQKAIDRKTRKGFKAWRCPIIVGVLQSRHEDPDNRRDECSFESRKGQEANYKERGHHYRWTEVGNKIQCACEHTPKEWIRQPNCRSQS